MSLSWFVQGFRPPDERWEQMKAIYESCKTADIEVPKEVLEFFDYEAPDPAGVKVDLRKMGAAAEWKDKYYNGFEVHLDRLPPEVKIIRFTVG